MAQKTPTPAASEPPKKRGKLLLIVSLLVVVAAGGGGAAWFFLKTDPAEKIAKPKPALFLPLEVFTANLMPDEGQPQFIQVGLTLKVTEQDTVTLVKERMPEVRNRILLVLSGKRGGDLLPLAGKQKLALDVAAAVQDVIGPAAKRAPEPAPAEAEAEPAAEETDGGVPKAKPARKSAAIEVLFTAFMIQ